MAIAEDSARPGQSGPTGLEPDDLGNMTIWEHLAELRKRLIISVVGFLIAVVLAFFLYNKFTNFIIHPYHEFLKHHPGDSISKGKLVINAPLDGFMTRLKVSGYLGIAISTPVWLWELWRFITPGLNKREKRYAVPFVLSALVLFALGVTASILIFPKALNFLIRAGGSNVAPLFSPSGYITLYVLSCLIFGTVFLYPIILVFLEISGVVPSRRWRKWRRQAIVAICFVAAVITPSNDPFSFMAMAGPMYVFYEASILIGRILKK
jgi:sec-independent protein translocase protein TatC